MNWGVVILAGGREDPELAEAIGTNRKALAQVNGHTSLELTLRAVREAGFERCVTVSGPEVRAEVSYGTWEPEGLTATENAGIGLAKLGPCDGVLFLPVDSPFLIAADLTNFVERLAGLVDSKLPWMGVGLCDHAAFVSEFSGTPATPLKFREGKMLSGALYAANPAAFEILKPLTEELRSNRKSQIGLAAKLGLVAVVRYLMGRMSLDQAEATVERLTKVRLHLLTKCHPRTVMDFDTRDEWQSVLRHATRTQKIPG